MQLYRSNRAEALVEALARVVSAPVADPFEPERIVVQGPGMERWLAQELSGRLGVFANAQFPFPKAFLQSAIGAVLGESEEVGVAWEPESLGWTIADVLPELVGHASFGQIRGYLQGEGSDEKLFALATRIARTFDHYAVHRPEMVLAWERGDDGATLAWSGRTSDWQPVLWRAIGERQGRGHWAERVRRFVAALATAKKPPVGLPPRACLFGLSTLPPLFVSALAAVAPHVELHCFVLSPSREYWASIRSEREILRERRRVGADRLDEATDLHLEEGHTLLASLGRVGRDFQQILEERIDYYESPAAGALGVDADLYRDPAADDETPSLLHLLQSDILALRNRGARGVDVPPAVLDPGDRSISLHACHGPMREAEVLRDQLLDLFAKDPTLEPHDVIVMAPEAASRAPFVEAAFAAEGETALALPVHVSDRGARASFPVVEAWNRVIDLLDGRLAAGEVLELLGQECIRARFGITSDDEELLRAWVDESGIRWAIDASHREREGQPAAVENTWQFGLDRLFVGMAIEDAPGRLFGGVRPQTGVEGSESEVLGRLADFTSRLFALHERARGMRPVAAWIGLMTDVLEQMINDDPERTHEQQLVRTGLEGLARATASAGHDRPVSLAVMREALDSWVSAARTRGGFLTGAITFCEMVPMRSIPFRVVCLLGLDDDRFPRVERRPDFDLIGARRRVGDRSSRDDDRQLFLEALLSARDHLIITYTGADVRDNEARPPSVVLDELIDHVGRACVPAADEAADVERHAKDPCDWARRRLVVTHPLKPWSRAYFSDADPEARLFSYSDAWAQAARRIAEPGTAPTPFVAAPLVAQSDEDRCLRLEDLQQYFAHPARYFLRDRLDVRLANAEEQGPDREPLDLDGLDAYGVGDELLAVAVEGGDPAWTLGSTTGLGILPLGESGRTAHAEVVAAVNRLAARVRRARSGDRLPPRDVACEIAGVRIEGRFTDLYSGGLVTQRFAKLGEPSELEVWIAHLLLCATAGDMEPKATHLIGRPGDDRCSHVRFEPVEDAAGRLADLIEIFRMGTSQPLPLFPRTSRKFAAKIVKADEDHDEHDEGNTGKDGALFDAYRHFSDPTSYRPESADPYVRQLFADVDPLAPSYRPVGIESSAYGFCELALRVFRPLLDHRKGFR